MPKIVVLLRIKINEETIPVAIMREFGAYSPELVEDTDMVLDTLDKSNPNFDWRHGKVIMCCFGQSAPLPVEYAPLPNGGEVIFADMHTQEPEFPRVLKDYTKCIDIGREKLLAGRTPEYAAAESWEFAKSSFHLKPYTENQVAFQEMVETMRDLEKSLRDDSEHSD